MGNLPRGIRNNNPLNIRRNPKNNWVGKLEGGELLDKEFEVFTSIEYGCRAALKLLRKYIKDGYNTPRKIIQRWAPPVENNTTAYLNMVCYWSDLEPYTVISHEDKDKLCRLAAAMARYENGVIVRLSHFLSAWELL